MMQMPDIHKKTTGRPVDHQKTQRVFDAIDDILANEGISGLSIERIAKNAGISKATLYRRFGDIQGVLGAYVETFTQNAFDQALQSKSVNLKSPLDLEPVLINIGIALMTLISQPRVVAFDNAMLASGPRFIEFKEALYRNGPQKAVSQISELLEQAGISSPLFDITTLGDILFHIWRSGFYDRVRITGQIEMDSQQLESHIASGTRFFLSNILAEEYQ
ncbi:MAG: TetR/AcrR family transcriptional regulator [Moritella sp.]|uniref:TetR/AcrR family transcriptional regulator n=1 Tax=Moritella sp. TaxID=78556 RepID=UPI001DB14076|nr:TetR/AcrR family transcriptional regulator [Moritella sp.]NQZ51394.1 TetR/AcrR family transcriptional regulator [Moritella sp.]